jgi:negative regulator of flagellin synthesis FlgM
MDMKVNGSPDAPAALTGGGKSTGKAAAKPAESSVAPSPVSLSDLSARLHALESSGSAEADFDTAKVEKIKQAIRDGKFEVDSSKVADKLISSVHELFGKKH